MPEMINILVSVLLSTIEIMSIFTFMLSLFRFRLISYLLPLLWIAIPMSIASYFIRNILLISPFKPLLMYLFFFTSIKYLFGLRFKQTLIVTIVGYIGYGLLQMVVVYGFVAVGMVSWTDASKIGPAGYLIQIVSFTSTLGIIQILNRKRLGFSFISKRYISVRGSSLQSIFIICILISATILVTILKVDAVLIELAALAADFYLLLLFSMRTEIEDQ